MASLSCFILRLDSNAVTARPSAQYVFSVMPVAWNFVSWCFLALSQAQRLFRDRLADSDSRTRFDGMLTAQLRSVWSHTADLTGVSLEKSSLTLISSADNSANNTTLPREVLPPEYHRRCVALVSIQRWEGFCWGRVFQRGIGESVESCFGS